MTLRFVVLAKLVLVAVLAASTSWDVEAQCTESATADNPTTDNNGCAYPACSSQEPTTENSNSWRCVHDSSFCTIKEWAVPAADVVAAGRICSCNDILSYPALIGVCNTNGVFSPMVLDSDCPDGSPVCEATANPKGNTYLIGDQSEPFTACDLTCNHLNDHLAQVPQDTYQTCEFPSFEWAVVSSGTTGSMTARNIQVVGDDVIVAGSIWSNQDPTVVGFEPNAIDVTLKGPFTSSDPMGTSATDLGHGVRAYGGKRPYEGGVAWINKNTGIPTKVVSIPGVGSQYINAMAIGGPLGAQRMILVGDNSAKGTMQFLTETCSASEEDGGAKTICTSEGETILQSHDASTSACVMSMNMDGTMKWMVQLWLELSAEELASQSTWYEMSISGAAVDNDGNAFVTGYKATQPGEVVNPGDGNFFLPDVVFTGMITKLDAATGAVLWTVEIPEAKHAVQCTHDSDDNALYVTAEVMEAIETPGILGVSCEDAPDGCSVLMRLSASTGDIEWVRHVHGVYGRPWGHSSVQLAHSSEGPYMYAAFQGAGTSGPSPLDSGTSYSGCKGADGAVTPEYDPIFRAAGVLAQNICTVNGKGTFFARDSTDAISAYAAATGVICGGYEGTSCLVKFHKYTGLPIWGTVKHRIFSYVAQSDKIVLTGSAVGPATFDTITAAGPLGGVSNYDMVWQAALNLDGEGLYVQPILADRSWTAGSGMAEDSDGEIYMTMLTTSSQTKFGPGAPGGWIIDLKIDMCEEGAIPCSGEQRMTVVKLGAEVQPSCIEECTSELRISSGHCFIDQVCYKDGESAEFIGLPCKACNAGKSQMEWSDAVSLGTSHCFISGACQNKEDPLTFQIGRSEFETSQCQMCDPEQDAVGWSVKTGFKLVEDKNPPDDCELDGSVSTPVQAPTPTPVQAPTPTPVQAPTLSPEQVPTSAPEQASGGSPSSTVGRNNEPESPDRLSGGAIGGIVIASLACVLIVGFVAMRVMSSSGASATEKQNGDSMSRGRETDSNNPTDMEGQIDDLQPLA